MHVRNTTHSCAHLGVLPKLPWALGAARLYDVLAACKNLEELELSATKITDLGVIPLAAALRENPPLRKLILDDNGITNEVRAIVL